MLNGGFLIEEKSRMRVMTDGRRACRVLARLENFATITGRKAPENLCRRRIQSDHSTQKLEFVYSRIGHHDIQSRLYVHVCINIYHDKGRQ